VLSGDAQEWQDRAAQKVSTDNAQPPPDGAVWPAIVVVLLGIGLLIYCAVRGGPICRGIMQFLILMLLSSGRGSSSSSGGGDSFSGGGGSFGGGGASGSW
jgi:uncharacterized membrane protein YgcG